MEIGISIMLFVAFAVQRSVSKYARRNPKISFDQPTGVYLETEDVTITCTVQAMMISYYDKAFCIYKDNQVLSRSPVSKQRERAMFSIPAFNHGGRYQCGYCSGISQFFSPMSEAVMVTVAEPLRKSVITIDQSTGVYVIGETVTMTCSVTGDDRQKTFNFYKDDALQYSRRLDTNVNTGTLPVAGKRSKVRYQCQYGISIGGRHLTSPKSEAVTVTTRDLPEPDISVDSSAVLLGGAVTFNCTSPGDNPAITFYLYREGDVNHDGLKSAASGNNSVTFTIRNIHHSEIGSYTCRYEVLLNGRKLASALSDPVHITVTAYNSTPIRLGPGALIMFGIVIILGIEFNPIKRNKGCKGADTDGVHCLANDDEEATE
ncbi:platelet endothelial cell adhesion molecule-like isoform X3 [Carcharodon carcharias]|uniref:platelet endothelial cell adhesion molecule-like isoform X3 n=1 Tax=Carcharodon carcharias TaxID=13397 RepID=UPI001B7DEABB|nr:platelet endothelial cell adhesion molecule-like isoform X3 [Carcharodon carcharias]